MLWKHLLNPLAFNRCRQAEQRELARSARLHFTNGGGYEQPRILHDALAHQRGGPSFRHFAFQRAQVPADTKLIDKPGHNAAEQGIVTDWLDGDWLVLGRTRSRWQVFGFSDFRQRCRSIRDAPKLPRDGKNLVKRLRHLPGRLPMNAVTPAALAGKIVFARELKSANERIKVRLIGSLKQLARFGNVFVNTTESHQEITATDQSGAKRGRWYTVVLRCFHQHARIARVHRQPQHLPTDGRKV